MADATSAAVDQQMPTAALLADGTAHPPVDQSELFAYRPALDGLRAVAVLAVVLYHGAELTTGRLDLAPAGFLGVDLFFVLSGFLITTLLLSEARRTGGIRLRAFWFRRARRLLPALFLVIAVVAVAFLAHEALDFDATQMHRFPGDALSSLFYVANWDAAFSGPSYFDQFAGVSPLRHMWSLAIEEQFYLLWPILVSVAVVKFRSAPRTLAVMAGVGALASATLMSLWYVPGSDPSRIYYGTDTRAQALLIGAAAAFLLIDVPRQALGRRRAQAAGWTGLIVGLLIIVLASDQSQWLYGGGFLLMAIAAVGAVIAASGPQDTSLARALSQRPLVWLGVRSYGLYLWHWPVFVLLDSQRTGMGGVGLLALRLATTVLLAFASYRLIEAPIRFGVLRRRPSRVLAVAGAAVCAAVIVASIVTVRPASTELALIDSPGPAAAPEPAPVVAKPGVRKVLLVGDSVMLSLARNQPAVDRYLMRTEAPLGCSISSGHLDLIDFRSRPASNQPECRNQLRTWTDQIRRFDPDLTLMLFGGWEALTMLQDGRRLEVGSIEFNNAKLDHLERARRVLTSRRARLVVLTAPCTAEFRPGVGLQEADTGGIENYNAVIGTFAARHPGTVSVLDLHGLLCPAGSFTGKLGDTAYTEDGTHFTQAGGATVWAWLYQQLDDLGAGARPSE